MQFSPYISETHRTTPKYFFTVAYIVQMLVRLQSYKTFEEPIT